MLRREHNNLKRRGKDAHGSATNNIVPVRRTGGSEPIDSESYAHTEGVSANPCPLYSKPGDVGESGSRNQRSAHAKIGQRAVPSAFWYAATLSPRAVCRSAPHMFRNSEDSQNRIANGVGKAWPVR